MASFTQFRQMVIAALSFSLLAAAARAESADVGFIAGLRERQLFQLAESYCTDRLARSPPDSAAAAELTIELIRTLGQHAANVPHAQQKPFWAKARSVAAEFLRRSPPHPRAILVEMQDALTLLAQGELARQEFEAGLLAADRLEAAQGALREAARLLEKLDQRLAREVPLRRRTPAAAGQLTAEQLFTLQHHIQQQLARARRNQALLFPRDSDNRLALLLAAVETLQQPLTQLAADDPLTPVIQLDLAESQRLLGRHEEAAQLAAGLDQDGLDPPIRLRARAELLRLAVAQASSAAIERLLEQERTIGDQSTAELDFARFEAFLALARNASEGKAPSSTAKSSAQLAKQYQDQAAQAADSLEETYGPYWGRRADQLLVTSLPRGGGNVQLLTRTADSLYLKGDFDQAIAAYDEAAAQARADADLNGAFDLAYKAALVEQKRERHASAANRLRILSKNFATHAQASQSHLLAAWNAAQVARADSAAGDGYASILREHLATWPNAESADQARIWLGRVNEAESNWADAIDAYSGVPKSSPHFTAATMALARCWPKHLTELTAAGKPTSEPAAEAIRGLQEAITGDEHRLPEPWTDADRATALAIAELIVAYQPASSSDAVRILEAALKGPPEPSAEWKAAARVPLALAMSELPGRRAEALAALASLARANPDNGSIQEKYADLLLATDDAESVKQSLDRWRTIASRSKPRSDRWFKAKHSVALAQFKLGDRAGAAALLRFLLETPPGLKGSAWEKPFVELLEKCGQP